MKAILVNPWAGGGRCQRVMARLLPRLAGWLAAPVLVPQTPGEMRHQTRQLVQEGYQRLVVAGGDGTIHLVANEVLEAGAGGRVVVGLVPAGTGCDLARALGIPKNPRQALELALEGPGLAVDAGHLSSPANSVFFLNVASAGISGLVDVLVNANPRRGGGAFLAATLTALRQYRGQWVSVQLDGLSVFTGLALLVAVANGKSFGKGMRVAPNARLDDGRLDVVVVEALPWRRLLLRLPLLYLGRHLRLPQVRFRQGERVLLEVEGSSPPFDVDGECYAAGPATFSVRPRAWHIAWAG